MDSRIRYNFEYDRKLRICFIGGHSFRNIYPAFQYAPVELMAICDQRPDRAAGARQFGASTHYTDHQEMLRRERPDAVFIVTAYHPDGRVQATDLALDEHVLRSVQSIAPPFAGKDKWCNALYPARKGVTFNGPDERDEKH